MAESKYYTKDQFSGRIEATTLQGGQSGTCETCQADDITRPAFGWCESCDESLCETCYKNHCKPKQMRDHLLCTIEDMTKRKQIRRLENKCQKHEGELLKYFCKGHTAIGCNQCFIANHRKCDEVFCISEVKTIETDEFKALEKRLSTLDKRLNSNGDRVGRNRELVARQHDKSVTDIEEAGEKLKTLIDRLVLEQIEEAEKAKEDNDRIIADDLTTNKVLSENLNTGREMLSAAKGDNDQLFITMKYMQSESALMEAKLDDMARKRNITVYEFEVHTQLASVPETVKELGILRDIHERNMEKGTDEVLDELEVNRFQSKAILLRKYYRSAGNPDAIQVSTDHDIRLNSVLLYPCLGGATDVSLAIMEDNNCLTESTSTHPETGDDVIEVKVTKDGSVEGVTLQSGHWYDIVVVIHGSGSHFGWNGQASVTVKGVKFSFRDSKQSKTRTNVGKGQIAGFRFLRL